MLFIDQRYLNNGTTPMPITDLQSREESHTREKDPTEKERTAAVIAKQGRATEGRAD